MIDLLDVNITHTSFYLTNRFASADAFSNKVKQNFPHALLYALQGNMEHPYLKDMQTAERFLHGGAQTYKVCRFLLTQFSPDLKRAGMKAFCVMLSYFQETNICALSFHYSLFGTNSDHIIGLRQSGEYRKYSFPDGELSCADLAAEICCKLGLPKKPNERSFLCEITKFGEYNSIEQIEKNEAQRLYAFLSGDEGYSFVPESIFRGRLAFSWGSRNFIRIYAVRQAFLFLNLLGSPAHEAYLQRQDVFGTATYGGCDSYFTMGSCPLTVNHGILFSVEFVMMLKALINDVISFQSEYSKKSRTPYYQRIRITRDFRRKIILVLEKVESSEISEIGELSTILLESQHISPIVDQVKYLLELLEADLNLIYSDRNNKLMTLLTILGLLLAGSQVVLALIG